MPRHPEFRTIFLAGAFAILLASCTITETRERVETQPMHPALQELAMTLPGRYVTPRQADNSPALMLNVSAQRADRPDQLRLIIEQQALDQPDRTPRRFQWLLSPGERHDLRAEFAPISSRGQIQRRCEMEVNLRHNGLSAQTDPATCNFGEDGSTGLLKEIAFDGSQLVIGDHLIDLGAGEPLAPEQVLRFVPVRSFRGWAGVREGNDWRMARNLAMNNRHGNHEPTDAAGMGLGIRLELVHYQMAGDAGRVVLRLSATDGESGQMLGEAWADMDARSIGLVLPDLQVGLDLVD